MICKMLIYFVILHRFRGGQYEAVDKVPLTLLGSVYLSSVLLYIQHFFSAVIFLIFFGKKFGEFIFYY